VFSHAPPGRNLFSLTLGTFAPTRLSVKAKSSGLHIPEDMAPTLGDLVLKLAADEKVEPGNLYRIGDVEMEVLKAAAGVPEKIKVTELTNSPH